MMKNLIYILLFSLMLALSVTAFSQTPPPPNNGNGAPSGGNTPVGGGAPVGSGLVILMALGAIYGSKKVFNLNIIDNE